MSSCRARYEGQAKWYDSYLSCGEWGYSSAHLARLLGPGGGRCLDIGCGTGFHFAAIRSTRRRLVGLDLSMDMLAVA